MFLHILVLLLLVFNVNLARTPAHLKGGKNNNELDSKKKELENALGLTRSGSLRANLNEVASETQLLAPVNVDNPNNPPSTAKGRTPGATILIIFKQLM